MRSDSAEKEIRETEAVVFVPCTPGGALQSQLQVAEDKFIQGTKLKRIRMVERGGIKLKDLLSSKDPWENESARTGYRRGKEHVEGLVKEWEKAPLWRHSAAFHRGSKETA